MADTINGAEYYSYPIHFDAERHTPSFEEIVRDRFQYKAAQRISKEDLLEYHGRFDRYQISTNKNIDLDFVLSTRDKASLKREVLFERWDWYYIAMHPNVNVKEFLTKIPLNDPIYERYPYIIIYLSSNRSITLEYVLSTRGTPLFERWDWMSLSGNMSIKFSEILDTYNPLSKNHFLSEKWSWNSISTRRDITLKDILSTLNITYKSKPLFKNRPLSENKLFFERWYWSNLSQIANITLKEVLSTKNTPVFEKWVWSGLNVNHNIKFKEVMELRETEPDLFEEWSFEGYSSNDGLTFGDVLSTYDTTTHEKTNDRLLMFHCLRSGKPCTSYSTDEKNPLFSLFERWDWKLLSCNHNVTWDIVLRFFPEKWDWVALRYNPMDRVPAARKIQRWWHRVCPKAKHAKKYYYVLLAIEMDPVNDKFREKFLNEAQKLGGVIDE